MSDQLRRFDVTRDADPPMDAFVAWAEATPPVRAVIRTGSRAVPGAPQEIDDRMVAHLESVRHGDR